MNEEKQNSDFKSQKTPYQQPYNDLEMQFMTTNPAWGYESPEHLLNELRIVQKEYNEKGETVEVNRQLWSLLAMYTRDLRLSNLGFFEIEYCQRWVDLANDCLSLRYVECFFHCMSRAITVLELSQSKGGFLRKLFNKITYHHKTENLTPEKKGLFGGRRKEQ